MQTKPPASAVTIRASNIRDVTAQNFFFVEFGVKVTKKVLCLAMLRKI